jgi:hypothetical protein
MPTIGKNSDCIAYTVKTEVVFYPYSKFGELKSCNDTEFILDESKILAKAVSDENGFYKMKINEGKYSVFVKRNNCFYANSFDGQNGINPVEIINGNCSLLNIMIDEAVH